MKGGGLIARFGADKAAHRRDVYSKRELGGASDGKHHQGKDCLYQGKRKEPYQDQRRDRCDTDDRHGRIGDVFLPEGIDDIGASHQQHDSEREVSICTRRRLTGMAAICGGFEPQNIEE